MAQKWLTDAYSITTALGGRWHGGYGMALCPAHENIRTPALSVKDGGVPDERARTQRAQD